MENRCELRYKCPFYQKYRDSSLLIEKALVDIYCIDGDNEDCKCLKYFKENNKFDENLKP